MSDPRSPHGRTDAAGVWLSAAALISCAAAGFLVYRLGHPARPVLQAVTPLPAPAAPASAEASPARRIPEVLPDFALPGLDGTAHRLSDWKGHTLLVNFWASWCEPCRREIPLLKRLRHERSADGLEVLGVALDFRDAAEKYARDARIDYPVLVGEQGGYEAAAAFGMDPVLPFSVFADRTGRIVTLKVGELHPDEASLILDQVRRVEAGTLSLPAAREEIANEISRLSLNRAASTGDSAR